MSLRGRNAIVTGATTGLGYAIAKAFLAEGANVAICGRDGARVEAARERLSRSMPPGLRVIGFACDVSRDEQVEAFVRNSLNELGNITILVNNAAVLGPIGRTDEIDLAAWRAVMDANFFGVALTCRAMLPHFRSHGYGKILNLSGGGATSPRPFFSAYATSKAAVVRLTENLAAELRDTAVDVNAIAPGPMNTRMFAEALAAGPERVGQSQHSDALRQLEKQLGSMDRASELCVFLASAAGDGITGKLISAQWDPWPFLNRHVEELRTTDIYTLRRIVPEDRAKRWH